MAPVRFAELAALFVECSECGHLHFNSRERTYEPCPVEGCPCPYAPRTYEVRDGTLVTAQRIDPNAA